MKFVIESCPTFIYKRITNAYKDALIRRGHEVVYLNPSSESQASVETSEVERQSFSDEYYKGLLASSTKDDVLLVFPNSTILNQVDDSSDDRRCHYEYFSGRIWFLHLDRIAGLFLKQEQSWRRMGDRVRSEEHTSELQSPDHLVCRLLLEKKKYLPIL